MAIGHFASCLADMSVWLVGLLAGWLAAWLVYLPVGWLLVWLSSSLVAELPGELLC